MLRLMSIGYGNFVRPLLPKLEPRHANGGNLRAVLRLRIDRISLLSPADVRSVTFVVFSWARLSVLEQTSVCEKRHGGGVG